MTESQTREGIKFNMPTNPDVQMPVRWADEQDDVDFLPDDPLTQFEFDIKADSNLVHDRRVPPAKMGLNLNYTYFNRIRVGYHQNSVILRGIEPQWQEDRLRRELTILDSDQMELLDRTQNGSTYLVRCCNTENFNRLLSYNSFKRQSTHNRPISVTVASEFFNTYGRSAPYNQYAQDGNAKGGSRQTSQPGSYQGREKISNRARILEPDFNDLRKNSTPFESRQAKPPLVTTVVVPKPVVNTTPTPSSLGSSSVTSTGEINLPSKRVPVVVAPRRLPKAEIGGLAITSKSAGIFGNAKPIDDKSQRSEVRDDVLYTESAIQSSSKTSTKPAQAPITPNQAPIISQHDSHAETAVSRTNEPYSELSTNILRSSDAYARHASLADRSNQLSHQEDDFPNLNTDVGNIKTKTESHSYTTESPISEMPKDAENLLKKQVVEHHNASPLMPPQVDTEGLRRDASAYVPSTNSVNVQSGINLNCAQQVSSINGGKHPQCFVPNHMTAAGPVAYDSSTGLSLKNPYYSPEAVMPVMSQEACKHYAPPISQRNISAVTMINAAASTSATVPVFFSDSAYTNPNPENSIMSHHMKLHPDYANDSNMIKNAHLSNNPYYNMGVQNVQGPIQSFNYSNMDGQHEQVHVRCENALPSSVQIYVDDKTFSQPIINSSGTQLESHASEVEDSKIPETQKPLAGVLSQTYNASPQSSPMQTNQKKSDLQGEVLESIDDSKVEVSRTSEPVKPKNVWEHRAAARESQKNSDTFNTKIAVEPDIDIQQESQGDHLHESTEVSASGVIRGRGNSRYNKQDGMLEMEKGEHLKRIQPREEGRGSSKNRTRRSRPNTSRRESGRRNEYSGSRYTEDYRGQSNSRQNHTYEGSHYRRPKSRHAQDDEQYTHEHSYNQTTLPNTTFEERHNKEASFSYTPEIEQASENADVESAKRSDLLDESRGAVPSESDNTRPTFNSYQSGSYHPGDGAPHFRRGRSGRGSARGRGTRRPNASRSFVNQAPKYRGNRSSPSAHRTNQESGVAHGSGASNRYSHKAEESNYNPLANKTSTTSASRPSKHRGTSGNRYHDLDIDD